MMKRNLFTMIMVLFTALLASGCTYYQVAPGTYSTTPPSKFDRSWSATVGAFADQGVRITREDRDAGVIHGTRDGINLTASVNRRADGGVRVEFSSSGETNNDPELIHRVSRAYERLMGR